MTPAQREAWQLVKVQGLSNVAAARQLGINESNVRLRIKNAERHMALDPGIQVAMAETGLQDAGKLHSGWLKTDGASLYFQAPQDETPEVDPDEAVKAICERLSDIPPAPYVARTSQIAAGHLNATLGADLHMGVTIGDYGPDKALQRAKDAHLECQDAMPPAERALILWNGDSTHANDDKDETFKSRHRLKVEGCHHDNIGRVIELADFQIQHELTRSEHVEYQIRPGNHDPSTPSYLVHALNARYANNSRVSIYQDVRWWGHFQWGKIFLGLHHGDGNKPKELAGAIPYIFTEAFAAATRHFLITAHLHSDKAETFGGLRWRQLPALTKLDQHGEQLGFVDTASLRAMRFNVETSAFSEYTAGLA